MLLLRAFKAERSSVTLNDGLTKPTISEELKHAWLVKATKHVGNLWVAEKVVEVAPEHFYVVAFTTRGFPRSIKHLMQEVAKSCTFDGDVFFICEGRRLQAFGKSYHSRGRETEILLMKVRSRIFLRDLTFNET